MAAINGTNLAAKIVPFTTDDQFATHEARYGQGGWREVATIAERDAITEQRREAGMAVYVTSEKKLYILNSDLVTWSLFSAGGVIEMPTPNETELGNIVQYIGETTENYTQGYFYKCVSDGADPATYSWKQIDVQPATELVWGNIEGDITNQTDLNTELTSLQDQIDSLSGRGRYLTLWNCSTGLAETNPPESPYEYRTGDYFIVGTVAASGGTNYRPDGSTYITGTASTVEETEEVNIDDTYIYDGSTWHLQYNSQKTVSFANIAGQPTDNTNLANALNSKLDKVDSASIVYGTDSEGNQTTYNMTTFGQIDNVAIHGVDQTITDKRVDLSVVEQVESLPVASENLVGRVVQYTGSNTQDLVHNYFYECKPIYTDETTVVKSASEQLIASADLNTFAQSGLEYNTPYLYEKHGAYWDCIDPEGITITGPRAGLLLSGVVNNNDQVRLQVDREFVWEQVNVQPETVLEWGNIGGTLSNQTDLKDALDAKQDTLTAGTGIDISTDASTGNLVISSTSSESFYRGTFATWTLVPTNPTNYVEDPIHHLKTPTNTDYMIVTDASDYYKPGAEITIQSKGYVGGTGYVLDISGKWDAHLIAYNTPYERVYGNNELIINFDSHNGAWSWRVRFNIPVVLNGTRYDAYDVWTGASGRGTRVFNEIVDKPCEGTWRFGYYGEWDTAGRNGWVAEYKIEDTLPIATPTVAGITKLYTTTGSNTDGTMDQSSITTELGKKQDVLTNESNAGEGIIIDDITQEISTNNIVWRKW